MQILLISGETEYTLADGPDRSVGKHCGPVFESGVSSILVDKQPAVRGTAQKSVSRGNLLESLAFSVNVLFETIAAADEYFVSYAAALPRSGTLKIVLDELNYYTISNATIDQIARGIRGVSVSLRYTISGGAITKVSL